jgi:hypothetical protein
MLACGDLFFPMILIRDGAGCRMAGYMDLPTKGGFDFGLCCRNQSLAEKKGLKIPGFLKTGTTIVGLVFQVRPISSLLPFRV